MTQEVFPEIQAAARALEQQIVVMETEIAGLKESIAGKKRLVRSWKKAIAAVIPKPAGEKKLAEAQ